jgi:cellulose synthase (UDP-forming)
MLLQQQVLLRRLQARMTEEYVKWSRPMSVITKSRMQRMHLMEIFWAVISFLAIALVAWIPMTQCQQFLFGFIVVVACIGFGALTKARFATHFMMTASVGVSVRYIWWRIHMVYAFGHGGQWNASMTRDLIFMLVLLLAEMYSVLVLLLGHFQSVAPLKRQPCPLPEDRMLWPQVDIFIPTYNEPLDLVRRTVVAAMELEWPREKLRVVLLDDGGRAEFRAFVEQEGVDYVARAEHHHAKAGNINHALIGSHAAFVAIFDCDHVPTRDFLLMTMGWMLKDEKIGLLQTPHHFYSPDPIERNLGLFRTVPNEGELFYGVIQDGNDLWNATFFCGSCAILRRAALDEIGGIAVESVSEDAHTSLRMQMKGWNTAYLNMILSAGLATESVAAHVTQRVRWARGMIQILRMDNPLLAKGLSFTQRLCYLNSMLHFMYAAPRLIFLLSPLTYLLLGQVNIPGRWLTILTYAMPHLILAIITNSRLQGHKRHSFWSEVYETILSPFIFLPTWLAMLNPKLGKFNVTQKGSQQDGRFDSAMARPFLVLLLLNLIGLGLAVMRYLYWNTDHRDTVIVNAIWVLFNMIILGVTVAVCLEKRQRRGSNPTSVLKTLNLLILGMTALQEIQ